MIDDMMNMEWDSPQWRERRDAQLMEWVGDADAVNFFLELSHFIEVFDDLVDQDKPVSKEDMAKSLFAVLYNIPLNNFFIRNKLLILPHMFSGINAWLDSNDLARGNHTEKALAFTLKGAGVDVLLAIISITRGVDYMRSVSVDIRRAIMGHQSFEDYCKEMANGQ